jgi:branched-chain amino acid transport system ATP-binding protein
MLEVDKISTFYDDFQALHEVSLKAEDGKLVALFGPNGHGKSTLLKSICGLLRPNSGSIKYNGIDISRLSIEKIVEMGIVYIAEDRHLFPEMTVLENLKMGAVNKNAHSKEEENFEYVYRLFPKLKTLRKNLASTLSGGEARMVAIGRGLMSNARLLAVDEPSLGLSPKLRIEVFEKIKEINNRGVSIFLVEQSTADIADIADSLYLMEDGRIVFEGGKEEALSDEHLRKVFLGIA